MASDAIFHFAASIVVSDSVRDPLSYYRNNTVNSGAVIECAVPCSLHSQRPSFLYVAIEKHAFCACRHISDGWR
jgi:nucleoside-diphosphate-sugar epimerase